MLLNYDAFKTIVQENFLSYMPFYFRGMELLISPVAKKNMTLDGLRLKGNLSLIHISEPTRPY